MYLNSFFCLGAFGDYFIFFSPGLLVGATPSFGHVDAQLAG